MSDEIVMTDKEIQFFHGTWHSGADQDQEGFLSLSEDGFFWVKNAWEIPEWMGVYEIHRDKLYSLAKLSPVSGVMVGYTLLRTYNLDSLIFGGLIYTKVSPCFVSNWQDATSLLARWKNGEPGTEPSRPSSRKTASTAS